MGIEALLHSTIHGRHGKNTGNSQNAGGESLAGGFAGLLQGHLSSPLGPSEATDGKSSPLMSDDASTPLLADTSLADPALLATIIPAAGSTEPRPSRPVDAKAPAANDQPAPTESSSAKRSASQDALAAAASALDAITPRNAAPIDGAAESTTRIAPSNNAPRTPAAPSTPIVDSGRFTDQLALASTRTAAPTAAQGDSQAYRQASTGEQTLTTEIPAATSATTPSVSNDNSARDIARKPATVTPAAPPATSPAQQTQQNMAEKPAPTQRKAIDQAFTSDRRNLATAPANAPANASADPLASATRAASPTQPATTSNDTPLPVNNQARGIATGIERMPETPSAPTPAFEFASAQRPAPRPLPSAQPAVSSQPTQDVDTAPEDPTPVLAKTTQNQVQTSSAPLPSVPLSSATAAPAIVTAATTESLSGRRAAIRNTVQESRGTPPSPLAAASDAGDEAFAVPQTGQAIRGAASASPVAASQAQSAAIAVTTDVKPENTDGSSVPSDSAKLAAMPAAPANTAPPAGLAVSGEASAAQHPETTLQLATHLRDPRWGEQLGERVVVLAQGEKNSSAQIDINPAQLGPIRVKIDMNGDQVSVQFSSASSEVRQVLEDALPRLREQLANSGIQLGQANVGSQSQQTPREAFAQSTPSPRSPGEGAILPAESPLEAQSSGRLIQSGRGLVDLFA
jgi:flagellar hook-length control protein FliK